MGHKRLERTLKGIEELARRADVQLKDDTLAGIRRKLEAEAAALKQIALEKSAEAEAKLQQTAEQTDQPPVLRRLTPQPDTGKQPPTDQPSVLEPHAYTERDFGKRAEGGPEIGKEREAYTGGSPEAIEGRFGGEWPKPKPEESYDAETRLRNL
ncbi:MAG: hypothetical protein H0X37_06425 [Herpetosiphonaceae bacterium]|nr:hypothetical protein [Herpetosiphonaceae bacterium]